MAGTFLELIESECARVQALRTHFVIVAALQAELDRRVGRQELIFGNTALRSMAIEHRLGLVQRLAGWVRALCGPEGLFDQIIEAHLKSVCTWSPEDGAASAIRTATMRALMARRFPGVAAPGSATAADIEALRSSMLEQAAPLLDSCDAIRRWFESATEVPPETLSLEAVSSFLGAAEELVNDLRLAHDGGVYGFSDHESQPSARDVARDLTDLLLLGTVDDMLSVTGVNERLGRSGAWWWQHREGFWESLAKAAKEHPQRPFNAPELVRAAATRVERQPLTTPQIERLVARYILEYARYEATARYVEERLRRIVVRERIKALISSRAKDAESLRGKLERKREKYSFWDLDVNLGSVVTDLAGATRRPL